MAGEAIGLARADLVDGLGPGGVGAHIGTALFFGHGHADGHAVFIEIGPVTVVVFLAQDARQPFRGDIRLVPERRHRGKGHGQRATAAGIGLGVQIGQPAAHHMGAGPWRSPGQAVMAGVNGRRHEPVVGRVIIHLVDAMAEAIMGLQLGSVAIGVKAGAQQAMPHVAAVVQQLLPAPVAAKAADVML